MPDTYFMPTFLLSLLLLLLTLPVQAAQTPASPSGLDPQQARQVMALLQDPEKRNELILALDAIATHGQAANSAATSDAPATMAAPAATDEQTLVPLEANGLIAKTLNRVGNWADNLGNEVLQVQHALRGLPAWSRASFNTAAGRQALWQALLIMAGLFAGGLSGEWLVRRLLGRARQTLHAHADQADQQAQLAARQQALQAANATPPETTPAVAAAAIQPAEPAVALVQTQRDGVARLEEVPLGPEDDPAIPAAAATASPEPTDRPELPAPPAESHWSTLRHIPYALGFLGLGLLPYLAFWAVAALLMHWLAADDDGLRHLVGGFLGAYLTTRVTLLILRLMMDPAAHGIRLFKVPAQLARTLLQWIRGFVGLVIFGLALAQAADVLGASEAGSEAIIKLVSLLAHLLVVALIIHIRRPIAVRIAGRRNDTSALGILRAWLSQVWAIFAIVLVLGAWTIWALDIENGLPRLMNAVVLSAAIVIAGRLAAIFLLGLLDRLFRRGLDQPDATASLARRKRYYPLARRLVSLGVMVLTGLALFQSWGGDVLGWFSVGSIGRSLTGALGTILVAALVAMAVWEGANAMVNRRLTRWTEQGDTVRAARLRTLLPMLRSALFIIIALIVILTTLSELGINTAPLLAGASIIGVALGFGSQKLVQDFITGIFLLLENAMQVGDFVTLAGVSGTVENLSIRTVRLRAGDGSLHIVPFSSVSAVNNVNRGIGNAALRISVGYSEDIERVIGELKAIGADMRADEGYRELIIADLEIWGVDAVDGAMVTIAGQMRCLDRGRWGVQRELNRRILVRFRERGIEIANPRASLLLPTEPGANLASAAAARPQEPT